jgi:rubrerythrin
VELNTASAVVSFYTRLEDEISRFYEELAAKVESPEGREAFAAFARESKKNRDMVDRAYRHVVTDAFETGFTFSGLNDEDYRIDTQLEDDLRFSDALKMAIDVEEVSRRLCSDASESSRALLADIAQAFGWVAERKSKRKATLESLLNG